jgi:hypothetical protein
MGTLTRREAERREDALARLGVHAALAKLLRRPQLGVRRSSRPPLTCSQARRVLTATGSSSGGSGAGHMDSAGVLGRGGRDRAGARTERRDQRLCCSDLVGTDQQLERIQLHGDLLQPSPEGRLVEARLVRVEGRKTIGAPASSGGTARGSPPPLRRRQPPPGASPHAPRTYRHFARGRGLWQYAALSAQPAAGRTAASQPRYPAGQQDRSGAWLRGAAIGCYRCALGPS